MQKTLYRQDTAPVQYALNLSARELEVLKLLVEGYSNPEIARAMYLSINTIKTHVRSIMNKFAVECRIQVAVFAVRHQLIK